MIVTADKAMKLPRQSTGHIATNSNLIALQTLFYTFLVFLQMCIIVLINPAGGIPS